jgi:hypothetical protein
MNLTTNDPSDFTAFVSAVVSAIVCGMLMLH